MKKNLSKRPLSWLLTLAMVFTMLPVSALAAEPETAPAPAADTWSVALGDPKWVSENSTFQFPNAVVTAPANITSMTVAVTAGSIDTAGATMTELGNQSATWIFNDGKTASDVAEVLKGVTFNYTSGMEVTVTLDGNTVSGTFTDAKLTEYKGHYYMFVAGALSWHQAYNGAKSYTYKGMKGYLATITTADEAAVLRKIDTQGAWTGGTLLLLKDGSKIGDATGIENAPGSLKRPDNLNTDDLKSAYYWACGPEKDAQVPDLWSNQEPNGRDLNGQKEVDDTIGLNNPAGESCVQANYSIAQFNDNHESNVIGADGSQTYTVKGYFVEFGGYQASPDPAGGYDNTKAVTASVTLNGESFRDTNLYVSKNGDPKVADGTKEKPYNSIVTATEKATTGSTIILLTDVEQTSNATTGIKKKTLTITSEGGPHTITMSGKLSAAYWHLSESGTHITLENIIMDGGTRTDGVYGEFFIDDGSTLTLGAGAVLQNFTPRAVNVRSGGTLTMLAGSQITGCIAGTNKKYPDTADGYDGTEGEGSAVYVCPNGTFDMKGGTITGNDTTGYAVFGENGSTFKMSGNVVVKDNKAPKGGDVYLGNYNNGSATIKLTGELTCPDGSIGVYTAKTPTQGNDVTIAEGSGYTATADDAKAFYSNNAEKAGIMFASNTIYLSVDARDILEVYVDAGEDGDDAHTGARDNPLKTLVKAIQTVSSGGTIYLMSDVEFASSFALLVQDNPTKEITITSDPKNAPAKYTIKCMGNSEVGSAPRGAYAQFYVAASNKLTLRNVTVDGNKEARESAGVNSTYGDFFIGPLTKDAEQNVISSLTLEEGVTLQNFSPRAVNVRGNGIVTMMPGSTITGCEAGYNATYSGDKYNGTDGVGAAVYVCPNGTFDMKGGTITGNTADGYTGTTDDVGIVGGMVPGGVAGIFGEKGATFKMSGAPVVTGNTFKGAEANVYLNDGATIKLTGAMTEGASVGVYVEPMPSPDKKLVTIAEGDNYDPKPADAKGFRSDKATQAGVSYQSGTKTIVLDYDARSVTGSVDANGEGFVQVEAAANKGYAVLDEQGKPITTAKAYDKDGKELPPDAKGWYNTDNGPITFKPIQAGSTPTVVSVDKAEMGSTNPADEKGKGTSVSIPTVVPGQITGRVEADGEDENNLANAYITIKPTDPSLSYAVVDSAGNVVLVDGAANGWKDGSATGALDFGPLNPGEKYEVVAVPKTTNPKPADDLKGKGTAITTPGVSGATNAEGVQVDPSAITRKNDEATGKDQIIIAGETTSDKLEYAVVDPVTGEVLKDANGDPIWKDGTAAEGNDLVFGGLEPNKKYEVVTRPKVNDGSIAVVARPGTVVEKLGVLKATGRVVFWPNGTEASEVGVAGATVRVTVSTLDGGYENLKATSDKDGYFTFEGNNIKLPAEYTVYADSNDITKGVYTQKDNFTSTQPQDLKDIRVYVVDPATKPNTNVTGGAVSDHGKPVQGDAGHKVIIRDKQTGEIVEVPGGLTPSASGGYTAGNFNDGTYILEFTTDDGKSGMTEIKVDKNKVVPNTTGGYTNTNIPVNKGGIISGEVEGLAKGETATISMNVPIYNEAGDAIIGTRTVTGVAEGEGGYWQIAGVPDGDYPITVTTPKGTITGTITVLAGKVTAADEGEGTPVDSMNPGTGEDDGKLIIKTPAAKPEKPNVITGAVVDKDNKPIVDAKVAIYNDKGEIVGTATTGEGGGYTVPNDLPAGKYYISADESGKNGLTGPVEVLADGTTKGKTSVTVSDAASKLLEGTVTKADGATKAAGATVTVKDKAGNVIATTKTDANGQYFVGSVPTGATVSIVTPDGESVSFLVADTKNNQTGEDGADGVWDGDQTTSKPAEGAKPVIGPNGSKLPIKMGAADDKKAGIAIAGPNGDADANSKFEINDKGDIIAKTGDDKPAPGAYTVTITDTNGMKVQQTITVNAEGVIADSKPITIQDHTITGTVKYETGAVPSDATITVPGWGASKVNTTTGKYELSGIPDGEYDAVISVTDSSKNAPDGETSTITVTLKVENGVATYTPGAAADTGATVTASGSTLTVKPTTAVTAIKDQIAAAQTAIEAVPTDKTADDYSAKLDEAIKAVKAAQDAVNSATEEELKQIDASASQKLADVLAKLMEGELSITAKAEGMSNATDAAKDLNAQKGMLVDGDELDTAKDPNKTVEVTLNLKADEVTNEPTSSVHKDVPQVEAVASAVGAKATALYEIAVEKTTVVKEEGVEVDTTVSTVSKLPTPITITLSIPNDLRGYDYYSVLRVHDHGAAERIPSSATATTITFASNLYSTYAILASNDPMFADDMEAGKDNQGGGSSTGGSSSSNVNVEKTQNGSVKVEKPNAGKGQTVVITVTPDPGFELDTLVVKDKNGNKLEVKDLGNGKYSFVMPDARPVTVTATFKETGATGDPNTNGVADLLIVDDHIAFMQGDDAGNFRPTGNITRAETAQLFYNLLKDKNVQGSKSFSDVSADAWYATAVNALANLGIVEGVGEGRFDPSRAISRAEFVTIAMRFATNVTGEKTFSDVSEDYWARGSITGAAYYGWINGYEDGTFKPTNPIARAEAATVVNNMLSREGDKSYIDSAEGLKLFPDVAKNYWAFYEIVEATNAHDFSRGEGGAESWTK